jgi:isopentenyldiphosphate isomerase
MDEYLDIINDDNEVIGRELKSIVHQMGLKHRVSAILLFDLEGKYMLPTASDKKVEAGGLFHSSAGHIPSGETYLQAAQREMQEELSLTVGEDDFIFFGSFSYVKEYPTRKENERFEVFKIEYRSEMGKISMNEEQINEQWLTENELKGIYLSNPDKLSYPLRLSCELLFKFK